MPTPDPFQSEVVQIALAAAAGHGFALGGGQALIAHGIVQRPTEDIDLFADEDGAVQSATSAVEQSLASSGLNVAVLPETTGLGELIYGFENDLVEFAVSRGDETVRLTLAKFDRTRDPITLDIGVVLHLDDVLGSKVAAMATRAEPRDFIDVAAALQHHEREQLIRLAKLSDPALTDDEICEGMRTLDRLRDHDFTRWIEIGAVPAMRDAFASWPRH